MGWAPACPRYFTEMGQFGRREGSLTQQYDCVGGCSRSGPYCRMGWSLPWGWTPGQCLQARERAGFPPSSLPTPFCYLSSCLNPALDVCYFILRRMNVRAHSASPTVGGLACASPALCLKSWPNEFCSLLLSLSFIVVIISCHSYFFPPRLVILQGLAIWLMCSDCSLQDLSSS